ncbi:MAG: ankyrin repeat domain-containing protein [Proteobacteria bacterium]|nr:ankyrin repeat domain-containing protein [Pseudomonadota bacterium]
MISLIDAVKEGDVETVRALLQQGANVDERDREGHTSLQFAAMKNRVEIARMLLDHGADLHAESIYGYDALHYAVQDKHSFIEQMLREALRQESIRMQFSEAWVAMDSHQIAHVGTYPALGQKLTTVFNFESRESLIIVDDLKTNAKAITPVMSFDEMPKAMLEKALQEFTQRGGAADRDFVLQGARRFIHRPK